MHVIELLMHPAAPFDDALDLSQWHTRSLHPAVHAAPAILTPLSTAIMSTKGALKAAKAAIDSKNWDEAVAHANTVLEKDANNYFAKLFLGRANDALSKYDDAAKAYNDAAQIKPDDAQAWLGLRGMYEGLGSRNVDENTAVGLKLAEIYVNLYAALFRLPIHFQQHSMVK